MNPRSSDLCCSRVNCISPLNNLLSPMFLWLHLNKSGLAIRILLFNMHVLATLHDIMNIMHIYRKTIIPKIFGIWVFHCGRSILKTDCRSDTLYFQKQNVNCTLCNFLLLWLILAMSNSTNICVGQVGQCLGFHRRVVSGMPNEIFFFLNKNVLLMWCWSRVEEKKKKKRQHCFVCLNDFK